MFKIHIMTKNIIHAILFFLFLFGFGLELSAQPSPTLYTSLESEGSMPADFKKILQEDKDNTDYTVLLRELVTDGRILYGTPLNHYLDNIADNLLKEDLVLRSKIHIYIVKSPTVNAFSTANGLIFVNLGLIAQVSNESELAFVLAHEIAHVAEKHVTKINDYGEGLRNRDILDAYIQYQNRSREQELAADRIAMERYMQPSEYSCAIVDGIFDVMLYGDLPFDEVPFRRDVVERPFYHFPDNHFLPNITPISNRADQIDTLHSHPNIEKRRSAALSISADIPESNRKRFRQPEALFNELREKARFECINIFLTEHQYDQAIYNIYVLQQTHPGDPFLENALAYAWYGFSKHRQNGYVGDVITPYKDLEGEMQQTSYFLSKLNKQEALVLALRHVWSVREHHPDNNGIQEMATDLLRDIFVRNKMKYNDFSDYPMGIDPDSIQPESPVTVDTAHGKYARIRQQSRPEKVIPTSKFKCVNYMLVDIHQDSTFVRAMNSAIRQAEDDAVLGLVSKRQPAQEKSIIITSPQYIQVPNSKRSEARLHKRVQQKERQMLAGTLTSAKRLKLQPVTFSTQTICSFTTEQYNQYAHLQQWIREYTSGEAIEMVYYNAQSINQVFELTGTSKICLIGAKSSPANFYGGNKTVLTILSVLCPYIIPMTVPVIAIPRENTEMYLIIADLSTGKVFISGRDSQISVINNAYLNAFIYEQLYRYVKGGRS